jgi:Tfp pilus assembly protein PilX
MEKQSNQIRQNKCRKNERGAALVTVLLVTFLLLVAVAALLLEASMNTANVTDATAEEQAYYAAESGIQSVVNVLRGNPDAVPNPLINVAPNNPANKISYFKAAKLCNSNASCDCTTNVCSNPMDAELRLSRWLPYDTTYTDRIILGATTQPAYTPQSGFAYKVRVENPDNAGNTVSFITSGNIGKQGSVWTGGGVTVTYLLKTVSDLDISSGSADNKNGDYGLFGRFVIGGNGTIPNRVRFAINVNMTEPYNTTKVIRGYIEAGTVTTTSVGTVKIFYDSQIFDISGSIITLSNGVLVEEMPPGAGTGEGGTYRTGYQVTPVVGVTEITGSITAPEPIRLLIRSTGFGPRGAQKQLEAIIQKNYFNGLGAPSPLTLIGPPNTVAPLPVNSFVFEPGTSTGTIYNGKDVYLKAFLPPIGVTNDTNLAVVNSETYKNPPQPFNGTVFGTSSNITDELPFWLQSPTNLDATLAELRDVAKASKRYFPLGSNLPDNGDYGNNFNATGITYIEGDLEFSQSGGGILVVTGGLTFKGGFDFNGLIIVTGAKGIDRTGGGSGSLQGNLIVAPYLPNDLTRGFLSPKYDISGGGGSEIVYNSNNVANGLGALSNFVKGVAEK